MKNDHSILFVGNSYTFYWDMPTKLFLPLASAEGNWQVTSVTHGGYHLEQFADPADEEGQNLRKAIDGRHFDFVVLQDHSLSAVCYPGSLDRAVGKLLALLQPHADKFVLYATWGRQPGCPTLNELGLTSEQMADIIADTYDQVADRYGLRVAHVGKAFVQAHRLHPDWELYYEDMHHSSELGSTIAAQTIWDVVRNWK